MRLRVAEEEWACEVDVVGEAAGVVAGVVVEVGAVDEGSECVAERAGQ